MGSIDAADGNPRTAAVCAHTRSTRREVSTLALVAGRIKEVSNGGIALPARVWRSSATGTTTGPGRLSALSSSDRPWWVVSGG
ncbi:hypothetical protein GCM10010483_01530 [Actinokineospora diospyrosa]